ncbi:multidrug resistance-associated ABC transporter [Crucibulum laeve]|uniref:Multidrug resistance-associated ABC transporter n=1 Tax=Crucibulum laeve TaxID=68775 RepID=A0A5C3LRT5_9AGAR|nr:multidrug resistance-associated ABC transporter [Crucibulum laeve]
MRLLTVQLRTDYGPIKGLSFYWSAKSVNSPWLSTLMIPVYTTLASLLLLSIHVFVTWCFRKGGAETKEELETSSVSGDIPRVERVSERLEIHVQRHGGAAIFWFMFARMIGCFSLLGLSAHTLASCYRDNRCQSHIIGTLIHHSLCAVYLYTSILSMISILSHEWGPTTTRHNATLLLIILGVYGYRDVWPLATTTDIPMDISEGKILWVKIAILSVVALVIPLIIPRKYEPIDPKDPMPIPNPELTASILSLQLYTFLDQIILTAYRIPHLSWNQLPPLSDGDRSKHLKEFAFPHLDTFHGAKKRHLFFGLMRVYRWEYSILALTVVVLSFSSFGPPIAINRILTYLETNGTETNIRPWFWIMWLFIAPMLNSFSRQWYIFIATRTLVRTEGLLTQLVFEHSLRIRLKAETSKAKASEDGEATVVATPDTASVNGQGSSTNTTLNGGSSPTSTIKGKDKAKPDTKKDDGPDKKKRAGEDNMTGKINNLITTDLSNIVESRDFLIAILYVPLQLILCIVFLYKVLGWSAFVGFSTILILFPIPGWIAKKLQTVQQKKMKKTDARIQIVSEAVNVLRMVKLFGWEQQMFQRIEEKRKEELYWLWLRKALDLSNGLMNFFITSLTMLVTYGTFTLIMKQQLNASIVFSSMSVFSMLRSQLHRIFYQITNTIQGKVSLDRVNEFLKNTELLDAYTPKSQDHFEILNSDEDSSNIGFKDAVFSWSTDPDDGTMTPSSRSFKLRIEGELLFKPGCMNLIIGPTGSGKTSMIMALLGEMHFIPSSPQSWFNLPRKGGVAFAAQESWVQNATIRDNILFGSELDEDRYRKVIRQCALERDLELFEAGDETEVGERGLTLSGGQKARVTLARAIYSSAEIIILDDVLAALDVHTSKWIVEECFKGDLIKGRTILMVTHNIALASSVADFVVSIGLDGTVTSHSSDISLALNIDPQLAREVESDEEKLKKGEEEIAPAKKETKADGKLIVAEEIVEGRVTWKSVKLFLLGLAGNGRPAIFFTIWLAGMICEELSNNLQVWFLGYWGTQYEHHAQSEVRVSFYLAVYSGITGIIIFFFSVTYMFYVYGSLRASKSIHEKLVGSILGTTLRWLDETPTSRIIARCTQDIRAVDGPVAQTLVAVVELSITFIVKLSVIILYTPVFVFPGLGVAIIGIFAGNIYIKAQMSVKREMSNAKAPLLAHLGASIAGLSSIRAYGAEEQFKVESLKRIDHYSRVARISYNLNRWIAVRIDGLGALFTTALASYLVRRRSASSANIGFSLNLAVDFCTMLLWLVRCYNEFEVQANSLERIQAYVDIEQEPKPTESGKPPAAWPTSGELRVEKLSARYSQTGPKVLHDISFNVQSGERIGVVGRTGSGKSSLTLALLRCILTEGNVFYDGIPTNKLNLDALRSNVTIIPQMPELLSGTLRRNLDPFEQHDDSTLNAALRDAGLFSLQTETDEGRITLDSNIASGGSNLSVGQRQIIALARAIVRKSKVLILDEATSAIDYKTDNIIQKTLRNELGSDVTVLTVAHRLQTIMDSDKIMVLDNGRIVEFDSPKVLLTREDSKLKALVDESGDKDALYEMAQGKASASQDGSR